MSDRHVLFFLIYKIQRQSPEVFCKKGVLINFAKFTGKHCVRGSFLIKLQAYACNFIKKEPLAQVLSCKFCEVSKSTFSYGTTPVAPSENRVLEFEQQVYFKRFLQQLSQQAEQETVIQSENLSQQYNISTGKYVGQTCRHFRKHKNSMLNKYNIAGFP